MTDEQATPATIKIRRTSPTPAQLAQARKRLEHLEDPAERAWQRAASTAIQEHEAKVEVHERQLAKARNRVERRALGPRPRLQLPSLPDFEKGATAAARRTGPIFGRFLIEPADGDVEGGTVHDVTSATEDCRLDAPGRTFVHFRDEVAAAFPNAEPCPYCAVKVRPQ